MSLKSKTNNKFSKKKIQSYRNIFDKNDWNGFKISGNRLIFSREKNNHDFPQGFNYIIDMIWGEN